MGQSGDALSQQAGRVESCSGQLNNTAYAKIISPKKEKNWILLRQRDGCVLECEVVCRHGALVTDLAL